MGSMNKEWHLAHPFPRDKTDVEKDKWRAEHRKNCGCGRKKKE